MFACLICPRPRVPEADAGTEALEELLTFDDLFLDYFNHYLALPAFPLRLRYDRLTGSLEEAGEEEDGEEEQEGAADEGGPAPTPPYGATEAQRGRILAWLQSQRLPLFLRSAATPRGHGVTGSQRRSVRGSGICTLRVARLNAPGMPPPPLLLSNASAPS
ncbi:uncharacterized protein LOC144943860 [Lampetra fluviatilis]